MSCFQLKNYEWNIVRLNAEKEYASKPFKLKVYTKFMAL